MGGNNFRAVCHVWAGSSWERPSGLVSGQRRHRVEGEDTCERLGALLGELAIPHDGLHLVPVRLLRQALVHLRHSDRRLSRRRFHSARQGAGRCTVPASARCACAGCQQDLAHRRNVKLGQAQDVAQLRQPRKLRRVALHHHRRACTTTIMDALDLGPKPHDIGRDTPELISPGAQQSHHHSGRLGRPLDSGIQRFAGAPMGSATTSPDMQYSRKLR